MCAPDIPIPTGLPSLLDVLCIFAAACDVAAIDAGFRTRADSASGWPLVSALGRLFEEFIKRYKKAPGSDKILALMGFQLTRVEAVCSQVRALLVPYAGCALHQVCRALVL